MREALFYTREEDRLQCNLCPHGCFILEGGTGLCMHRKNVEGKLIADGYAKVSSIALDPIEKKPLYHFYPGSTILSVGSLWCNLRCLFCQNWHIAHKEQKTALVQPERLLELALEDNSVGIAFTYNEPIIWYEYVYDTAQLFKKNGLKTILVTNGFIQEEPLEKLLPYVDALNIDVKAFKEEFYRKFCNGALADVMRTVEKAAGQVHVEITTLVIGGLNDDRQDMRDLTTWLAGIHEDIPLHISRYYPNYKMQNPATSIDILYELRNMASEFINYVYIGNVAGADNSTYCPQCGYKVIERGYIVTMVGLQDGKCVACGLPIPIIM